MFTQYNTLQAWGCFMTQRIASHSFSDDDAMTLNTAAYFDLYSVFIHLLVHVLTYTVCDKLQHSCSLYIL